MPSSPSLWRRENDRFRPRSLIGRPTTEVSIEEVNRELYQRHSDSETLLETLSKIKEESARARSTSSQTQSSNTLPRTVSSALPGVTDLALQGPTTLKKPHLRKIDTSEDVLQGTGISAQRSDNAPSLAAEEGNPGLHTRSAQDTTLLHHNKQEVSAINRSLRESAFKPRAPSLKSLASSTGSSEQDKERGLKRTRKIPRSRLAETQRYPDSEEVFSPSTGSSDHWYSKGEDLDAHYTGPSHYLEVTPDLDAHYTGPSHYSEVTLDPFAVSGEIPGSRPLVPSPEIRLERHATMPMVAPDPIVANYNQSLHANTGEYLGIPHGNTFRRTMHQGEVSIRPEVKWPEILPTTIEANLHLRFHGLRGTTKESKTVPCFVWYLADSYKTLFAKRTIATPANHELYLRHACCCVLDSPRFKQELYFSNVYDDDPTTLSQHAIQDICGFIGLHPFHPFTLEIYWDYSSVQLTPPDSSSDGLHASLADTIQSEIDRKMEATTNFQGQKYVARRDLDPFLDSGVVDMVVEDDNSLKRLLPDEGERRRFARSLQTLPAVILFAICVYQKLDMGVLWHFVTKHHFSDKNLPNTDIPCDWQPCSGKIRTVCAAKPAFFPKRIEEDRKLHILAKDDVMPLYHAGDNNTKKSLGNGAFGTVYEVGIDPAHTYLSGNPEFRFALKEFSEEPRRRRAFDQEYKMLKILADYTDEHIVAPHTFWMQDEKCFILYPKAETSLRGFTQKKPPDLGRENVLWFLEQIKGLAEALDHVHTLNQLPTRTNPNPKEAIMWGSHRDIKPENILVFETFKPVFKIADFGAGEFNPVTKDGVSKGFPDAPGTPTYFAPDLKMGRKVSRPADMWALGCVYLELLLWYFQFFTAEHVLGFSTRRAEFTGADPNIKTDLFWYKERSSYQPDPKKDMYVFLLRPAVVDALHDLTKICHKMRTFERLIKVIRRLLTIDSEARWQASKLARSLKRITRQARVDLRDQPDYYTRLHHQNTGGSVQDVKLPNEAINPLISMAGSTRSASLSSHRRLDSMDRPGPSKLSASPTSPILVATGTADALDAHSINTPIELSDPDEPTASPSRSSNLDVPRSRSMS